MKGVLTPEYLRNTIRELKKLQENIDELRTSVSNSYADTLGTQENCCVQ